LFIIRRFPPRLGGKDVEIVKRRRENAARFLFFSSQKERPARKAATQKPIAASTEEYPGGDTKKSPKLTESSK